MWNKVASIFLFLSLLQFFSFLLNYFKKDILHVKEEFAQDLDNSFSAQYGQEDILEWTNAKQRTNRNHANKRPFPPG